MTGVDKTLTFGYRDEFQRSGIAEKIIELLISDVDVSPMVIDGNWGSGKTEFTNKLINKLSDQNSEYHYVYIDAFLSDHSDDPLISILAEIIKLLPESDKKKNFKATASTALKVSAKTFLKGGVNLILRQDGVDAINDWDDAIAEAADLAINRSIDKMLDQQAKADSSFQALIDAIEEIVKEKAIIFFIDELDRCKPDYSIKLFERIKHVFNIDNVQFVIIANKNQLRSAINHCYGSNIDAQKYLDKFLKFSFSLPEMDSASVNRFTLNSEKHYYHLIESSSILSNTNLNKYPHEEFIKTLFLENKTSLREVETFVRYLEILQRLDNSFKRADIGVLLLNLLGAFIFCFKPEILRNIDSKKVDALEINKLFGVDQFNAVKNPEGINGRVDFIVCLIFFEANINNYSSSEDMGVSDRYFDQLKESISRYFQSYRAYGQERYLNVMLNVFETLRLNN